MKLYITRHGETMRNAEQRILGRTDDPLSEKGRAQAAELIQKGMKYEIIADDYDAIKGLAVADGKSVNQFISALRNERIER